MSAPAVVACAVHQLSVHVNGVRRHGSAFCRTILTSSGHVNVTSPAANTRTA